MSIVRTGVVTDIGSICRFVRELAEYEKLSHEVTFTDTQYMDYLFMKPHPPHPEVLIAELNDTPVGMALYIPILESTIHLEDLYVTPHARGQGLGLALLQKLASTAVTTGVPSLEWSCLDWNKPSLDFYNSLGATRIPHRALYRITGDALRSPGPLPDSSDAFNITEIKDMPAEMDRKLRGIELVSRSSGNTVASLFYTLSFTTFKATPVILVTNIICSSGPTGLEETAMIIGYMVNEAHRLQSARVDIRINDCEDAEIAKLLIDRFGAFELKGWIPLSLTGDSLMGLANRIVL